MAIPEKTIGQRVPDTSFQIRRDGGWATLTTSEIFSGKRVVVFALPGAFTPTCSSTHLPGYAAGIERLHDTGIEAICCLSVNDSFVMNAWAEGLGIDDRITMIPDGNADFTREMGMLVDKSHLGFGDRSWRYSMVVEDGVITALFSEDRADLGDPFAVSDIETMLHHLEE
ncbi:MAG: hypothetical protein CMM46_08620 [Rhodospirillaceae bacterium]|nr:hypothetical protein [Rhodospirillaceae bacterium]|tara:strand:+ start:3045 stop:3554 length:510 start_codon:yes stop_codon:yes gene_type:complete